MSGKLVLFLFALVCVCYATSVFTQAEIQDMLNRHNTDRAKFGSPPLIWDNHIADVAQAYADRCVYEHNPNRNAQCGGKGCGENIASSTSSKLPVPEATYQGWGDEAKDWSCSTKNGGTCAAGKVCGHWTQIIWKNTSKIGCGKRACSVNSPWASNPSFQNWHFLVCDYADPGNWNGEPAVSSCVPTPITPRSPPTNPPTNPPVAPRTPTNPPVAPRNPPTNPPVAPRAPTNPPVAPHAPVAPRSPSANGYVKCLSDPGTTHLSYRFWSGRAGTWDPSDCRDLCAGKSFPVFGLQTGSWKFCVCFSSNPTTATTDDSNCNGQCTSGPCKIGNANALALYN